MSKLFGEFMLVVWLVGGLGAIFAPFVALGTIILAVVGVRRSREPLRALAFSIPCLSTIVLYTLVLVLPMSNLEPPFFIGGWLVFLGVYVVGLARFVRRQVRS